jgi:GR25 family glycosyltransferase involved in LPS biosynthesis
VITTAKAFGWKTIVILEDDARINDDFQSKLDEIIKKVPNDVDLIYIGGILWKAFNGRKIKNSFFEASNSIISGTHGYIAFEKGYDIILEKLYELVASTDDMLNEAIVYEKLIKAYAVRPWICYQDNVVSDITPGLVVDRSKSRI